MKTTGRPADREPAPSTSSSAPPEPSGAFGATLREERRKRKLSVRHLANLSGMSASYLSRIEHGQLPPPSAKIMHRLAAALNIEVGALQAAAGLVPERVMAVIRDRPAVLIVLSLLDRLSDKELCDWCESVLERRSISN